MACTGLNYYHGLGTVQRYSRHYRPPADAVPDAALAAKKSKKPKKLKKAVRKKRRAPLIQPSGGMNHC